MAILEVKELRKNFGGVCAIDDLSFKCEKGDRIGIIGPNGSGKTTAFALISGFIPPDGGEVWYDGCRINGLGPHEICRRGLCRTFQIPKPFQELTVLENMVVAAYLRYSDSGRARRKAEEAIERFGFEDKVGLPAGKLNVADRKRLELARVYTTEPQLILMDEIGAGLTREEVGLLIQLVMELNEKSGITFLIVEHIMAVIKSLAKRVIVLHYGRKITEGSCQDVAQNPQVIEAYLGEDSLLA